MTSGEYLGCFFIAPFIWTPPVFKGFECLTRQEQFAALYPALLQPNLPLRALMESADLLLISLSSLTLLELFRFSRSRSDLFRHHSSSSQPLTFSLRGAALAHFAAYAGFMLM